MSSEFEKRLSNEELKRRNLPPEVGVTLVDDVPTQTPTPVCPMEEQWRQMVALQVHTVKLLEHITEQLDEYPAPPSLSPVTERLAAMEKELSAVRQTVEMIEQAGRKKGRRFSLPKLRLPQLPRPTGVAFYPDGGGGLVGDLARVERSLDDGHDMAGMTVPEHIDRKRWAELQERRLATGHRLDDNEQKM